MPPSGRSCLRVRPHTRRTALLANHPLGSAEITHPFHPRRGQRFVVLKVRRVSGVETLSLRHVRSEEHTSELQLHSDLVCRLLLEKKKKPGSGAAGRRRIAPGRRPASSSCTIRMEPRRTPPRQKGRARAPRPPAPPPGNPC